MNASQVSQQEQPRVCAVPVPSPLREEVFSIEASYRSDGAIFHLHEMEFTNKSRVLTLSFVLPICYFLTCGGPTGIEPIVASSSPLLTLIGLLAFPILVSVPFGLLISEMCTAFPDDGGFVIWVANAFGPFWGFQEGFWSWGSTVLNNALYPGFILTALSNGIKSSVVEYILKVTIAIVISLPTLFGTKFVGRSSALLVVVVIVPFIIATAWFFGEAQGLGVLAQMPRDASIDPPKQIDWKTFITQLFWSYDGMYVVSLFGGQIANPSYTYPRAIFITLLMTMVTYLLPITAALVANRFDWWNLEEGSMARLARVVGGSLLHSALVMSAVCSNVGLFGTAAFAKCYLVNGMAQQGLAPAILSRRHRLFETPYLALLVNTVPVLFVMAFDLTVLQDAANCISAASQVLMIVAAIKLRVVHGDNYQFKKSPGGNPAVVLAMIMPLVVVGYVFTVSLGYIAAAIGVLGGICGVVFTFYAKGSLHS